MKANSSNFTKVIGIVITLVLLGSIFYLRAVQNYTKQNYYNSNFFVFWLSGKLISEGESPYNVEQWANGHETYGGIVPREPTFLYPLPLAVFLAPLGFLEIGLAYFIWQLTSQAVIAFVVFALLKKWANPTHNRLLVPIIVFLLFYGPVYLTLQIGSLGPLTLLILFGALSLLEKDRAFPAGLLLSLTMLKPPQGVTILLLICIMFLIKRQWNAIFGIVVGGILLLLIGIAVDSNWVSVFQHGGQAAFDRRLGVQSNVWSFAYLACNGASTCSMLLGGTLSLILLGLGGLFLWRNRPQGAAPAKLSTWEAFNIIIPIGFISTVYLWSYDQLPYIIPIVWIIGTLVQKTRTYLYAFLFLIVLVLFSLFALVQQASTDKDLWSLGTTILVLGMAFWLYFRSTSTDRQDTPANA